MELIQFTKNNMIQCKYTPLDGKLVFLVNNKFYDKLSNSNSIKSEFFTSYLICIKNCPVKTSVIILNRHYIIFLIFNFIKLF